jgi:Zn-dependent peptidase ImmA (M78 family)
MTVSTHRAARDGTRDAERVLDAAWRTGGRTPLPVDVLSIAKGLGVTVGEKSLEDEGLAGALVKFAGKDPRIVVHGPDRPSRKRYTCAHALGHFVQQADAPDEYEVFDERDIFAPAVTEPAEVHANAFADALLMPEQPLRVLIADGYYDLELALAFHVPRELVHRRLSALGLLRRKAG